jgi:hypothetical protein
VVIRLFLEFEVLNFVWNLVLGIWNLKYNAMKKITIIFCSCLIVAAMQAQILHVPAEYSSIQSAVDAAGYGDTILVAPGTYLENVMIQGNEKTVTLASNYLFSGDTNDIINTIIDASQPQNPNNGMGVLFKNQDSTLDSRLIGFTITGGTGYYKTYGGGIYAWLATPLIEHNHIINCSVSGLGPHGGGIHIGNGTGADRTAIIRGNVIKNCTVSGTIESFGGGISLHWVRSVVENNQIIQNNLTGGMGTVYAGGGMYMLSPSEGTIISENEISDNISAEYNDSYGGGIFMERESYDTSQAVPLVEKNMIHRNMAWRGGGIYCDMIEIRLINNIISGNLSNYSGGAVVIQGTTIAGPIVEIINNTITSNKVTGPGGIGGGMVLTGNSSVLLMNNIFHENQSALGEEIYISDGTVVQIQNCNIDTDKIQGTWTGEDNFEGDPCFCEDGCHIESGSCCMDSGIDSLQFEGTWYYAPDEDFEGTARPYDFGFDVGADENDMAKVPDVQSIITNSLIITVRPNPFSGHATFDYELEEDEFMTITVYNHLGQQVAVVVNEQQAKGTHQVHWNAEGLPTGVYFCQLALGNRQWAVGKVMIVR